jgi:uncharacterized protein (DUF1015 family)
MAAQVASPPYDVLSSDEAREMAKDNPYSFLRINKAEIDFPPGVDPYGGAIYEKGRENLRQYMADGVMIRDVKPSFYLYRLTWRERSQTGLVALTSVDEYDRGLIKKHEHIRPAKMHDRANHIEVLQAQVGPVFSTFKHTEEIIDLFEGITTRPPDTNFLAADDVRHELWVVDDSATVQKITAAFGKLPSLYIADGHHRSASASEVCRRMKAKQPAITGEEPFNFFLNVIFPDNHLRILAYNRVVTDCNGLSLADLLVRAESAFSIAKSPKEVLPAQPHEFGLYSDGSWYRLVAKPGTWDEASATKSIDASILGDNLIAPVLGITDPKTDDRIDFVGGIRGNKELVKLVDSGKYTLAFSLYPTSVAQLLRVADAGEVMPPKSTWFEPKLRSGMVVNLLTD